MKNNKYIRDYLIKIILWIVYSTNIATNLPKKVKNHTITPVKLLIDPGYIK
jgi:hypothetical protein